VWANVTLRGEEPEADEPLDLRLHMPQPRGGIEATAAFGNANLPLPPRQSPARGADTRNFFDSSGRRFDPSSNTPTGAHAREANRNRRASASVIHNAKVDTIAR
jgi:hypothetical protein